ncbi:MAG: glycosyltransferase family 2 protein [Deltaproteobacteria bacterium]|nr:MAG: glycosyltransferase family 2 protein [Deltaproteobacteria bacterium]
MATREPQGVHVSLIVPAFNEEARIGKSLDLILDFLQSQRYSFEVIIADDGSRDGTVELVRDRFGRHSNVKILSQLRNQGKGEAVKQGMLSASGDYLFFSDADLSVPIESLPAFLARLENHCDVIIGTRKKAGALIEVHQPFYREFMGKTYTTLSNWILALQLSDFTCGFKGFRREAAKVLFSLQRLKNWSFDSEILYLAQLKGYKIEEIPVTWRDDKATKVKLWRDAVSSFLGLVKIRANQYVRRYE